MYYFTYSHQQPHEEDAINTFLTEDETGLWSHGSWMEEQVGIQSNLTPKLALNHAFTIHSRKWNKGPLGSLTTNKDTPNKYYTSDYQAVRYL